MDAVEQLHLQQGQRACWLRLTDELTAAILHTKIFPTGRWSQVPGSAVQAELRKAFTRWGRPQRRHFLRMAVLSPVGGGHSVWLCVYARTSAMQSIKSFAS
jgi:hypothetical protein